MKIDKDLMTKFILKMDLKFISGKYFKPDNTEIKNIKRYIYTLFYNTFKEFPDDSKYGYVLEGIKNNPRQEQTDIWPTFPLVKEAISKAQTGYKPEKLVFPLDDKQLQLINIMLFHPEEEAFFITTGVGGSGKSTFLNIVKQLFGDDVSAASLSDLGNSFILTDALTHRIIASDEIGDNEIDLPVIKQIASKQKILVNPKNEHPYTTKCQSPCFYCCNKAPKLDISDTGILRRIIYYKRNTKIVNPDKSLKDRKYTDEELLDIAIAAYYKENALWREMFRAETFEYLIINNSVGIYYKKHIKRPLNTLSYQEYREFCSDKGYKAYNENNYEQILDWIVSEQEAINSIDNPELPF